MVGSCIKRLQRRSVLEGNTIRSCVPLSEGVVFNPSSIVNLVESIMSVSAVSSGQSHLAHMGSLNQRPAGPVQAPAANANAAPPPPQAGQMALAQAPTSAPPSPPPASSGRGRVVDTYA